MGRTRTSSSIQRLTVLVVDDLEANRKLLRLQLSAAGLRVIAASDGASALRKLRRTKVDAIVSDILMPRMDGYQLCLRVRALPRLTHLPFFFYSATFTSRRDELYARSVGADAVLQKPIDPKHLIRVVQTVQQRGRRRRVRRLPNIDTAFRQHAAQLAMKLEEKNSELERKQADLISHEEILRALIESAAELIVVTDREGRIVTANAAALEAAGRPLVELQSMTFIDLIPAAERESMRATIKEIATRYEGVRYLELPIESPDGRIRWLGLNARHRLVDGIQSGWYLIARDITELRKAELALVESERRYRLLFDANPLPMWVFDLDTLRFLAVNETAIRSYGYSRDEFLSMSITDIRPPEDVPHLRKALAVVRTQVGSLGTARHRRKDGTIVTAEITGHDISFDGRNARLILANDITERLAMQEELVARERRLTSFFTGATAGLAIWDAQLRYVLINETLADINGWSVAEHLGRTVDEILPEIAPVIGPIIRTVLESGVPQFNVDVSGPTRKAPGVVRHWTTSYFPIRGHDDRVEGVGGIIVETTALKRAAEALSDSEAELRALFAAMDDLVIVLDGDGRYLQIAPTNPSRLKLPATQLLGKRVSDVMSPGEAETIMRAVADALRRKELVRVEYRLQLGDDEIWFEGCVSPISDHSVIWVARDITERRREQQAMREMHHQLKYLFDTLDEAFYSVDTVMNRTLQISPAMERIFGRPIADFYANPMQWYEMILSEDRPAVDVKMNEMRSGEAAMVQFRIQRPDGAVRWVESIIKPTLAADRSLQRVDGICFDVTERRAAEQRLIEQAALLDQARESISVLDLHGTIIYWNRGSERLYGFSSKEAIGRNVVELLQIQPVSVVETARRRVIESGEWGGELQQRHRSGAAVLAESHWTLVKDERGQPRSIFVINADITERRQLQAQLTHALKMESLGTLAGGIAHDFNNILGIIMAHASLLESHLQEPHRLRDGIGRVVTAAERGAGLVRQLLTFARKSEVVLAPVNLNAVVEEVAALLTRTMPRTIVIRTEPGRALPKILGDATQIHQVLVNLGVNARDAMPRGGELVFGTALDTAAVVRERFAEAVATDHIRLTVRDNGEGMDEATLSRIFEPFFTTKELGKGTGLGLATVFGIVRSHNAHIDVRSAPGRGTTFTIWFPAPTLGPDAAAAERPANSDSNGRGETLLLVEDEEGLRTVARQSLETLGYHVIAAEDGAEGLRRFEESQASIDLVITDLGLPKLDGGRLVGMIREMGSNIPVIVTSGFVEPEIRAELEHDRSTSILHKPYRFSDLLKAVRSRLDARASPEQRSDHE